MTSRRAWLVPALAALTLAASGCGGPQNGGDIVTSGTTPATVPNGPGTPTDTGSTSSGTTSTSSTATGAAPAPGSSDTPLSQDQQQGTTTSTP